MKISLNTTLKSYINNVIFRIERCWWIFVEKKDSKKRKKTDGLNRK